MLFEWDENKNRINKTKHGVDFETAALVFDDPICASRIERTVDDEERWQTIGVAEEKALPLLVAHTYRDGQDTIIRIISARRADNHERERYGKGIF
jgi:uncharacterized DUF497 family protein